ncbi:MAG: prepilin-type N-terminal cleavage/methylation domain-containing protein [Bacilli bacterium]|nr:prepilin-type N-terminal cleavage/methylation domain-containing protein [Bacilli bacterium]
MKKNKGFTLVELLAVIVILAIIMIIAIPAVLQTMQSARQKTFKEYVTKVYTTGQNAYLSNQTLGGNASGVKPVTVTFKTQPGCTAFDVKEGLGLSSTGSYEGAVVVCPGTGVNDPTKIYVGLKDDNYSTKGFILYEGEDKIELVGKDDTEALSYTTVSASNNSIS